MIKATVTLAPNFKSWEFPIANFISSYSCLFVCPYCVKIWGMIKVPTRDFTCSLTISCEKCNIPRWSHLIPGSILEASETLIEELPYELLHRELVLHLKGNYDSDT